MYKARRTDAYFRRELNKFIQASEKHARNEKTRWISCPCKTCKNLRIFNDTTTIRSHVLVGSFVGDYMIWTYHGENAPPPTDNPLDKIIPEVQFDRMFDAYDNFDGGGSDDSTNQAVANAKQTKETN